MNQWSRNCLADSKTCVWAGWDRHGDSLTHCACRHGTCCLYLKRQRGSNYSFIHLHVSHNTKFSWPFLTYQRQKCYDLHLSSAKAYNLERSSHLLESSKFYVKHNDNTVIDINMCEQNNMYTVVLEHNVPVWAYCFVLVDYTLWGREGLHS